MACTANKKNTKFLFSGFLLRTLNDRDYHSQANYGNPGIPINNQAEQWEVVAVCTSFFQVI